MRFDTLHTILPATARDDRQITLIEGDKEQRVLSFQRLRQRALVVLGALQRQLIGPGDTVILCLGDNERFLEMFWACVLGGIVPVPLAPGATDAHRRKLLRVFAQLGPKTSVYIDTPSLERLDGFATAQGFAKEAAALRARALIPGVLDIGGEQGQPLTPQPDDLAFIQYSSGSTGEPKGVLLTHRNLCTNIASIIEAGAFSARDVALSWMPLSHDMGLIGFHLNMLACGASHAIMRTDLFARRPLLWLEQASQRRATVLCSPNFGYQHYLRQFALKPPPQGLNLSSVRLIFNGAEPISAELCRRFTAALAPYGLKSNAMFPVYGLAEASLAVSFPLPSMTLETVDLDRTALRIGAPVHVVPHGSDHAAEFVKLGRAVPGCTVRIADDTGAELSDRTVGHVQIRGDNVSRGYFGDEAATTASRSPGGWLDTGDLGLHIDGQLVITGRAKDLIIVNGQNYYPDDLELIAQQVPGIEANRVAAVGVRATGEDTESVALFVIHRGELADFVPKVRALRRAISQQTDLELTEVVPVMAIPKTTSGKLQRYALAHAFKEGEFDTIRTELAECLSADAATPPAGGGQKSTALRLKEICEPLIPDQQITVQTNLLEINLKSLTLARIHEAIEREFPQRIEVTDLFEYPTLEQLANFLDETRA
ncbi:non-ribosomal peptide synthetase [Ramlibacter sp. H39-3-26]|uniref:non-ribosomal peptide synthetase n=1 Tax=Curvibacter soli TaxID=3031331 RepID=UPI0023DC04BB|nr:non-ribosomal peptide synthetase [Ramlibacter sp. H39-3-26]MDF1485071.1 non-ribosomal peptide synthetase [Ramlibacter sp. H39-3-26]